MMRIHIKRALPWLGIPALCLGYLLVKLGREEAFALLQSELLILLGYVGAVYDIRAKRLPNGIVLAMLGAWVLSVFPQFLMRPQYALDALADAALGFALAGGLFLLVYWISRRGLGGGDVKFMAAAGAYLGMGKVLGAMLYGSVLAALFALGLLFTKKLGRKDTIPLVPFLYAGILITLFLQ